MSIRDDIEDEITETELRAALDRSNRNLAKAKARAEQMVDAAYKGAKDAMLLAGPLPPVPAPRKDRRSKDAEVALWHLTDWQGHKLTTSYDSSVMRERVFRFCDKATIITEIQRQDHPVRDCVIAFGGDMVEGLFNYPTQPYEIDAPLHEQWANVSRLVAETVRRALSIYDNVQVVAEWGNHGRIGDKRAAVVRADNVDRMVYNTARIILDDHPRLTWEDCPEDIQRLQVGNYRALVIHGDEAGRNGFVSAQTMVQHVNRWRSGAYPWQFQDVYVGHYHRHAEEPLADGVGAVYWTGSTESDNRYAREQMAASAQPSQRLHFIDPDKGRVTSQWKVWLDG